VSGYVYSLCVRGNVSVSLTVLDQTSSWVLALRFERPYDVMGSRHRGALARPLDDRHFGRCALTRPPQRGTPVLPHRPASTAAACRSPQPASLCVDRRACSDRAIRSPSMRQVLQRFATCPLLNACSRYRRHARTHARMRTYGGIEACALAGALSGTAAGSSDRHVAQGASSNASAASSLRRAGVYAVHRWRHAHGYVCDIGLWQWAGLVRMH
jgi:hypothetical protein